MGPVWTVVPSHAESNIFTVPGAFGETRPQKATGVPGVVKALARSRVEEVEVNTIWVGCKPAESAKVGAALGPSTPRARTAAASATRAR
jgi:hypothetical protein